MKRNKLLKLLDLEDLYLYKVKEGSAMLIDYASIS